MVMGVPVWYSVAGKKRIRDASVSNQQGTIQERKG